VFGACLSNQSLGFLKLIKLVLWTVFRVIRSLAYLFYKFTYAEPMYIWSYRFNDKLTLFLYGNVQENESNHFSKNESYSLFS
jgi:hypothetical protein